MGRPAATSRAPVRAGAAAIRARSIGGLALVGAALGCAPPERVPVTLPALPATAGIAFLAAYAPEGTAIHAIDPRRPDPDALPSFDDAPDQLGFVVLAYDEPFASFPIAAQGRLEPTLETPSFDLPPAGLFFRAEVTPTAVGAWAPLAAVPPELARLHFPGRRSHCLRYRQRAVAIGAPVESAVALDERTIMVLTTSGPFFSVSAADGYVPHEIAVPADVPRLVAHKDRLGRIFLFGDRGATARYDVPTRTFTNLAPMPAGEELGYIDMGETSTTGRFWVLGTRAQFDAFEDGRWLGHPHPARFENRDYARGIAQSGATIVTTRHDAPNVQVYADDTITTVNSPTNVGFGSAITVPDYGIVLGATDGSVYHFTPPNGFELLPDGDSPTGDRHRLPIYSTAVSGRSVLLGSTGGSLGQYQLDEGYCPTITVTRTSVEEIVPVNPREWVIVDDDAPSVTWLEQE